MSNAGLKVAPEAPLAEPLILAVDTSSPDANMTVSGGEEIAATLIVRSHRPHSQTLFSHILAILDIAGVKINDIGAFAVATGPGSFTGLRVGLAAVKGLADSLGKPSFGVDSLDLQALASGADGLHLVMISAGRGEVYCGLREVAAGEVIGRSSSDKAGEPLPSLQALIQSIWQSTLIVIGDGGAKYKDEVFEFINDLRTTGAATIIPQNVIFLRQSLSASTALARIGARLLKSAYPSSVTPHYVRPSDAEVKWKQ